MVQCGNRRDILEIIAIHIKKYPSNLDYQNKEGWTL